MIILFGIILNTFLSFTLSYKNPFRIFSYLWWEYTILVLLLTVIAIPHLIGAIAKL